MIRLSCFAITDVIFVLTELFYVDVPSNLLYGKSFIAQGHTSKVILKNEQKPPGCSIYQLFFALLFVRAAFVCFTLVWLFISLLSIQFLLFGKGTSVSYLKSY